jgi:hypothetical protein
VPLFRALNESTAEMGALLKRYETKLAVAAPDSRARQD